MELLIPGLILVALMVYASTRIKRNAAAAFEPETIETEEFCIQKPEGFLNVIGVDPRYKLEAYSKEYGVGDAAEFRQARATLTVHEGKTARNVISEFRREGRQIVDDLSEVVGGNRYRVLESKRAESGIEFRVINKIGERGGDAFDLEVIRLADIDAEFEKRADELVRGFELK